jgi:hypothetical protein
MLLLSESRAIINDLDVILHGFMLQIFNTKKKLTMFAGGKYTEFRIPLTRCTMYEQ